MTDLLMMVAFCMAINIAVAVGLFCGWKLATWIDHTFF